MNVGSPLRRIKRIALLGLVPFLAIVTTLVATHISYAQSAPFNVQPSQLMPDSATISWQTSDAEDSKVAYGSSTSYGSSENSVAVQNDHEVTISGLSPNTTYHYSVGSILNGSNSQDYVFTTPYNFGVLTGDPSTYVTSSHDIDEYSNGVHYKTLELAWDQYETADGVYNDSYIAAKVAELARYRAYGSVWCWI